MVITVDFLQQLPYEITELIITYLNGNDIISCSNVCRNWNNILNRDCIWRLLCRQQGWEKEDDSKIESEHNWQEYYWLNYNWRNGVYKKYTQVVPEGGCLQITLNEQIVVISHVLGSHIHMFGSLPSNHQNIYCGDYHFQTKISGESIVIKLRDSINIYSRGKSKDNKHYNKVKTISVNPESDDYDSNLNLNSAIIETGSDRLVVIHREDKANKILSWNTRNGVKYESINLEDKIKHIFKVIISNDKLYLVILKDNEYRINVYDFIKERWSFEILAFKNVAFGIIPPDIQVSKKLIVGFCPLNIDRDLCYGYSPLKVWDSNGKFIKSIVLNSGRIDYFSFCLSNDLLIYRHSEATVKVWKPLVDEEISEFNVQPEIFEIDRCINNMLVLSYDRFFEVWDYKLRKRLYSVITAEDKATLVQDKIKTNRFYYAKQDRSKKIVTVFSFLNECNTINHNKDSNYNWTVIHDDCKK